MAKVIKYGDTSKIESDFKQAPVGLYVLHCDSIEQKQSKNDEAMVEVVFTPVKDANGKKLKEKFGRIWFYAPLDPEASWARRLKDLITAFGLKPRNGNLAAIEGKECLGRLKEDTDQDGNYRPNIGKLLPLKQQVDEEEEEEEDETNGELDEMSRAELKAYIKENELEVRVTKNMDDEDIVAAIRELEDEEEEEEEEPEDEVEEEEEEEEDEEEEDEGPSDNYESLSVADLRQELSDRELETKGKRTVLIARLRTDDVEEPV